MDKMLDFKDLEHEDDFRRTESLFRVAGINGWGFNKTVCWDDWYANHDRKITVIVEADVDDGYTYILPVEIENDISDDWTKFNEADKEAERIAVKELSQYGRVLSAESHTAHRGKFNTSRQIRNAVERSRFYVDHDKKVKCVSASGEWV